jgi:DnaJ-class molecular chaperone
VRCRCGRLALVNADGRGETVAEVELIVVLVLLMFGYLLSLKLNPWVRCSRCKNSPKIKGWLFGNAHHVCPKCEGSGQQLRLGRRLLRFKDPVGPADR